MPPAPDWCAGDIAECIRDDWRELATFKAPRVGSQLIVTAVLPGHAKGNGEPGWALRLAGYPALWSAGAFRKVMPPSAVAERHAAERAPV